MHLLERTKTNDCLKAV